LLRFVLAVTACSPPMDRDVWSIGPFERSLVLCNLRHTLQRGAGRRASQRREKVKNRQAGVWGLALQSKNEKKNHNAAIARPGFQARGGRRREVISAPSTHPLPGPQVRAAHQGLGQPAPPEDRPFAQDGTRARLPQTFHSSTRSAKRQFAPPICGPFLPGITRQRVGFPLMIFD